jgi:hypothetical protein
MLLIVGLGFVLNSIWGAGSGVLSYATGVSTTTLLQETNIQRGNNSRNALSLNSQLNAAAQEKANDMAARNYWSHVTPEGREPWQFISAAGYTYSYAGENLAYGFATSAEAVVGWMNSPSHRDNLLSANYTDVGFGFANAADYQNSGEQTIVVAMYAAPQKVTAAVPQSTTLAPAPVQTTPKPKPAAQPTPAPAAPAATPAAEDTTNPTPAVAQNNAPSGPVAGNSRSASVPLKSQEVSRFDILTSGNAQWAGLVVSVLVTLAGITMVYRHGKMWKKYIIKGERFIIHHPALDIAVVALLVAGVLLSQTTGVIH